MNQKLIIIAGLITLILLVGRYYFSQQLVSKSIDSSSQFGNRFGYGANVNQNNANQASQPQQFNQDNCLSDDCLLVDNLEYPVDALPAEVQTALDEAINDEYKALSTYQAVVAQFGSVRPFAMIIGAEEQHIASLKAIYDKYGLEVPANTWPNQVTAPSTLTEACQIGVEAEIANAALYRDQLLPAVSGYEDITLVFTSLMNASQDKHLPAFERCN